MQIVRAPLCLWELACLRCKHCGLSVKPQGCHRGQARSYKGWGGELQIARAPLCLWELACLRCQHCGLSVKPQGCHRR